MHAEITQILLQGVDRGASDILIAAGKPPMFRISGDLTPCAGSDLTPEGAAALCRQLMDGEQAELLAREHDVDLAMALPGVGRFRVNIHHQRGTHAAAIRCISDRIPTLSQLQLPPAVEELTHLDHGLLLVTGQTGSGKSTTLAAMIDCINQRDPKHIITLENPIEFHFPHGKSLIEQREIGVDCPSFESGLRHVLRQDPDVILVGELRDLETIRIALQAAETGHLVLATLHSSTAAGSIDRIIEVFPADEQAQIRSHLADSLRGVISQQLLPSAKGTGRVAAVEILIATRAIQTSIRERASHLIPGMISTGRRVGMQTMEQAIKELSLNGRIKPQPALSSSKEDLLLAGSR